MGAHNKNPRTAMLMKPLAWACGGVVGMSAHAQAVPQAEQSMPVVVVEAERLEQRTYKREEIDATPQGNRDLTSLIADHPGVRLEKTMDGSGNHGSLAPESFSIHGESPYQNQFLIDGMGATNAISPHNSNLGLQVGNVPGFAQAYNIDTELLEQVEVYDSKVPVEFGHFTGGVVDAKIKTPRGSNTWRAKRSFNSSNLTQQHMPAGVEPQWQAGGPGYSATWVKHFSSIVGDVALTQDSAALLSFSRRTSAIRRTGLEMDRSAAQPNGKATQKIARDQSDQVDNLMAKLSTNWGGGTRTNLTLKYADRQEDLVHASFADTAWTNQQKAMGLGLDLVQALEAGALTLKLGVDHLDALRNSSSTEFVTQQFVDKSLSQYSYGGYGKEALQQHQYNAKLRMNWNAVQLGDVLHQLYGGVDAQTIDASFERFQDVYAYRAVQQADGSQKIYSKTHYMAGVANAGYNCLGLYLNDSMQWHNWTWTVGARLDHDNLFKNTNWAPRTRLDWDVQGNAQTQLNVGWARYYGLDMLGYALSAEKSKLKRTVVDSLGNVVNAPAAGEIHNFQGVRTPYSDEWALGVTQALTGDWEAGLSYVRRASRDGVTQEGSSPTYTYGNGGRSQTQTTTLSLRTTRPWRAAAALWTGRLDFSWQRTERNHNSLDGWESEAELPDDLIVYNGQAIQRRDKPASGFHQPRTLSLGFTGKWQSAGVTWGNRINWKSSRQGIAYLGTVPKNQPHAGAENYSAQRLASYATWDTTVTWVPAQLAGVSLTVDVLNVLNKKAPIAVASASAANNVRYQTGREIWLNLGYAF